MINKYCSVIAVLLFTLSTCMLEAAPKKLLVLGTTTGFRHTTIMAIEKVLTQLGNESHEFTLDFVNQPPNKPPTPGKNATDAEKAVFAEAEAKWEISLKEALKKMAPESLKNYDGVVFASTSGDLPIPDPQGFLDWIKAGHAFIGIHAASDTFHQWPAFFEMLGAEFDHHGAQVSIECINADPQHPSTAHLGKTWTITQEEVYQFKNYDSTKVHDLLWLDKSPDPLPRQVSGHYPVAWCKTYGTGRVFFTSLGHREDIIITDPAVKDRINSVEIATAYHQHLLGGIEWALGIK